MSVAATSFMWQMKLKPHLKIVLLALADVADEKGYCWPSIAYLATQAVMDKRSVQRALKSLCDLELLVIKPRYIKGKVQTSNGYNLLLNSRGDKLPPHHKQSCHEGMTTLPPRDGVDDILTTKKRTRTKKLLPVTQLNEKDASLNSMDYKFPKQLSLQNQKDAQKMLACLPLAAANDLLEVLGNKLNKNTVKSPMAYLFTLVDKVKKNEYVKEANLSKKIIGDSRPRPFSQVQYAKVDKLKIESHLSRMHVALNSN
jgi:Helix-turn-helix domain